MIEGSYYPQDSPSRRSDSERLSAVERDVSHLDERISSLARTVDEGFSGIHRALTSQKRPITEFAGWAAVILTLVGAILWPQIKMDERLERGFLTLAGHHHEHEMQHSHVGSQVELNSLKEKYNNLSTTLNAKITELDNSLKQEIVRERAIIEDRLMQSEEHNTMRHDDQQRQLDELKHWTLDGRKYGNFGLQSQGE